MNNFEVGKNYQTRSICNHECIFRGTVIKTTAKTITLDVKGFGIKTCKVHEYNGEQFVFPLGRYSMAPTFTT